MLSWLVVLPSAVVMVNAQSSYVIHHLLSLSSTTFSPSVACVVSDEQRPWYVIVPAKSVLNLYSALSSKTSPISSTSVGFGITLKGVIFNAGNFLPLSRSEEHTSELQSRPHLVCRLL